MVGPEAFTLPREIPGGLFQGMGRHGNGPRPFFGVWPRSFILASRNGPFPSRAWAARGDGRPGFFPRRGKFSRPGARGWGGLAEVLKKTLTGGKE